MSGRERHPPATLPRMDVIGEARELEPDEELPPAKERSAGAWVDALGLGALGLSLVSAVGPTGALFIGLLGSDSLYGADQGRSFLDVLRFIAPNAAMGGAALVLAALGIVRSDSTTPRWSGAVARSAVIVSVVVLLVLAGMGAWFVLEEPPNPFADELSQDVEYVPDDVER
jgi:hypothetical protein